MTASTDWLSRLLTLIPVSGQLDIRCLFGAPWEINESAATPGTIPYHIIVEGTALLEIDGQVPARQLHAGDILILPHGIAHTLRDGSGKPARPARQSSLPNIVLNENAGGGARLDMLCGRFSITPPHDRLLRAYLPPLLITQATPEAQDSTSETSTQLTHLVKLMRSEADSSSLGGHAMLNALSSALFTLVLRRASESASAPTGLLALAGNPRLAPALSALFQEPAKAWSMSDLAAVCHMSRATFARHFQTSMGCSANDLLIDIRMTMAANLLKRPSMSVSAVSEAIGYQSDSAFQRAFKFHMGMTPARWRRQVQAAEETS